MFFFLILFFYFFLFYFFFFNHPATTEIYTLSLHDALPISARAIRRAAELDWHPVLLLVNAAASIANALRPAGLQNAVGVISTSFLKDADDATWKEDPSIKTWLAFMDKYYPDGDREDSYAIFGYAAAETLFQVLTQCCN